jgi:hypothetical protein
MNAGKLSDGIGNIGRIARRLGRDGVVRGMFAPRPFRTDDAACAAHEPRPYQDRIPGFQSTRSRRRELAEEKSEGA